MWSFMREGTRTQIPHSDLPCPLKKTHTNTPGGRAKTLYSLDPFAEAFGVSIAELLKGI